MGSLCGLKPPIFNFISLVNTEGGVLRVGLALFVIGISLTGYRKAKSGLGISFCYCPQFSPPF
jgi:hypothetical protein